LPRARASRGTLAGLFRALARTVSFRGHGGGL
jgi:hypothetical protein